MNHLRITIALLALFVAMTMGAVPAKRQATTYTQTDGTSVTITLTGDERYHGYTTLDGFVVQQNSVGDWCYVDVNGITSVIAHDVAARNDAEAQFVAHSARVFQAPIKSRRHTPRLDNVDDSWAQVPCVGQPHIPIILVNYTDVKFKGTQPVDRMTEHLVTKQMSAAQYFSDQSFGKFKPQFDILGLVELSSNRATYGANDSWGDDKGLGAMVTEACTGIGSVDWSKYDNNNDGNVDVVIVLYAGPGEAQGGSPSTVWPCQWSLDESDYGKNLTIGSKTISQFAVFCELAGSSDSGTTLDGIGTFCHEFSHCMGLPDFYPTNGANNYGMGSWSLMDYGCYNDDGDTPVGYTAYERNFFKWMNLDTPTPNSSITLATVPQGGKAYKIVNDMGGSGNEYFIVENRQKTGWEKYMASSGMMITHVFYDKKSWNENTVNNLSTRQRMTVVPADGKSSLYNEAGDLYPYGSNNSFTDTTQPKASVYVSSEASKLLHKPIVDITRNNNGSISFVFMPIKGDVNADNAIDVADCNVLINITLGKESAATYGSRAVINNDATIDVADVNQVLNLLLGK